MSSARALAVSDDGNVIVGNGTIQGDSRKRAVRWKRNPGTNTFNVLDLRICQRIEEIRLSDIEAYGVNQDGIVIVGSCHFLVSQYFRQSIGFIWMENETPKVQTLRNIGASNLTNAYDVITKSDGTNISVGGSIQDLASNVIAARWNNLSIEDLRFTLP